MLLAGAVALSIPAATLASGGGSAGDQQYTDPFAGTSTPTRTSHPPTTVTSPPASPTTTAAPTITVAPTPTPTPSPATATATGTPTSDPSPTPTATTAANQLPYTGYDSGLAGALGLALVGGGLALRRRLRRA